VGKDEGLDVAWAGGHKCWFYMLDVKQSGDIFLNLSKTLIKSSEESTINIKTATVKATSATLMFPSPLVENLTTKQ